MNVVQVRRLMLYCWWMALLQSGSYAWGNWTQRRHERRGEAREYLPDRFCTVYYWWCSHRFYRWSSLMKILSYDSVFKTATTAVSLIVTQRCHAAWQNWEERLRIFSQLPSLFPVSTICFSSLHCAEESYFIVNVFRRYMVTVNLKSIFFRLTIFDENNSNTLCIRLSLLSSIDELQKYCLTSYIYLPCSGASELYSTAPWEAIVAWY